MKKILFSRMLICLIVLSAIVQDHYGQSIQQAEQIKLPKFIYGKLYKDSGGNRNPASLKQIVLLPDTDLNFMLATASQDPFDEATISKISGATTSITSPDGMYQFRDLKAGRYIVRVTGKNGMLFKFEIPSNVYVRKRIPDMPAENPN